mgnify:FL=1
MSLPSKPSERTRLIRGVSSTTAMFSRAGGLPRRGGSDCFDCSGSSSRFHHLTIPLLGASSILPYLTILSSTDYFQTLYPRHPTQYTFPFLNFWWLLVGTSLVMSFGQRASLRAKILLPNALNTILLSPLPHIRSLPPTYLVLSLLSLSASIPQSTLYGIASKRKDSAIFIVRLESGKAIAGIYNVVVRMGGKIFTSHWTGASEGTLTFKDSSVKAFFLASGLMLFLSCVAFLIMEDDLNCSRSPPSSTPSQGGLYLERESSVTSRQDNKIPIPFGEAQGKPPPAAVIPPLLTKMQTVRAIYLQVVAVFLSFALCISLFPGLSTSLRSQTFGLKSYFPVLIVAVYNFSDLVGKWSAGRFPLPPWESGRQILLPLILLVMTVPLLVISKVADDNEKDGSSEAPTLSFFGNDAAKLLFVSMLGTLTGYTSTSALILAPKKLVDNDNKEFAGQFMSMSLIFGLFVGSLVGVILSRLTTSGLDDGIPVPYPVFNNGD